MFKILYEDEHMLAIDKPVGVVVNKAESVSDLTVQEWAALKFKAQISNIKNDTSEDVKVFVERSGVAHRLDKDTSGVLLLAKSPIVLKGLMKQFKDRVTKKAYIAILYGILEPGFGAMRLPIERDTYDRTRFRVWPSGKLAETAYTLIKVLKSEKKGPFSLVSIAPKTGRTHQIRVHMAHIKHPVVGDVVYGGKMGRADYDRLKRHLLHAQKISFFHPISNEWMTLESPVPKEFDLCLT